MANSLNGVTALNNANNVPAMCQLAAAQQPAAA